MTIASRLGDVAAEAAERVPVDVLRTRLLTNLVAAVGDEDESRLVAAALGDPADAAGRAHRLAARMHARTQDDFYPAGRIHVGTIVIPAVLAVGATDVHGAVAAGYETFARIADSYGAEAQRRGWRPSGVFGAMGAAAAAAIGLGLDSEATTNAIAMATAHCAGTNQSWVDGSGEWLLVVASASRAGVECALLASQGVRGATAAFEGGAGWATAFFGESDAAELDRALADDRLRTPHVAVKPFPVSGIAQAPSAAACALSEPGTTWRSVEVRMNPRELAYPGSGNRGPFRSRSDALMSIALCVTLGLRDGEVRYRALTDDLGADGHALLQRVELVADADVAETDAFVRAVDDQGRAHEEHARGDALLYPAWDDVADAKALSHQYDAPPDTTDALVRLVADGASADELLSAVSGR
jgi:2-methylcitrate dehydratase PrpD